MTGWRHRTSHTCYHVLTTEFKVLPQDWTSLHSDSVERIFYLRTSMSLTKWVKGLVLLHVYFQVNQSSAKFYFLRTCTLLFFSHVSLRLLPKPTQVPLEPDTDSSIDSAYKRVSIEPFNAVHVYGTQKWLLVTKSFPKCLIPKRLTKCY